MPRISLLVAFFEFLYFFMFSRISRFQKCLVLVLVCLQVFPKKPKPKGLWAILGLGTPRQDTSLSSHTNKRLPSLTLSPHATTPHLLTPPHPTYSSHDHLSQPPQYTNPLLHPSPHIHTFHTVCQRKC